MFIHKYVVGDLTLYMAGPSQPPAGIINVTRKNWRGRSTGASVGNAVKFLDKLDFSKDILEEEKKEEKAEEKGKEAMDVTRVAKAVSELDAIAEEIQGQDPVVAYLIDRVSDQLEGKTASIPSGKHKQDSDIKKKLEELKRNTGGKLIRVFNDIGNLAKGEEIYEGVMEEYPGWGIDDFKNLQKMIDDQLHGRF